MSKIKKNPKIAEFGVVLMQESIPQGLRIDYHNTGRPWSEIFRVRKSIPTLGIDYNFWKTKRESIPERVFDYQLIIDSHVPI